MTSTDHTSAGEVPQGNPLIPNAAWAGALAEHPRLLGGREFLRELSIRKADFYQVMKSLTPRQWLDRTSHAHIGTNDLLACGVIHALEGLPRERIEPYVQRALSAVAGGVTNLHQTSWVAMEQAVLAYDLFHDQFSPADGRRLIDWLNAQLISYTDDEGAFHNSTLSKINCYLRVAYGTWGDNPHACVFRDYALKRLYEGRLVKVLREFGQGGGFTECGWYVRHCLWHLVQGLELARRFDGYDGFAMAPSFFYHRLAYELHQPYPGRWLHGAERYSCEGDGEYKYSEFCEFPRLTRTVLAQYFRGSELAALTMTNRREGTSNHIRVFDFLYEEPPQPAMELAKAPLGHLAGGIGKVFARGSWTDDASWLRFECGPWWTQHQHYEALNFEIFRREPLATESGEYAGWGTPHSLNWLIRTIAHNSILIDMPGEKWHSFRNSDNIQMANDGGQGNRSAPMGDVEIWKGHTHDLGRGRIAAYRDEPEFLYVAGDATRAYSDLKASKVLRQIVFIRPHTFVILDNVVSTDAAYKKTWLLHCQNEPAIDGCDFTIVNGRGELHVRNLLPELSSISKIGGYSYGGQTYDPARHRDPADLVPQWRIEVSPRSPRLQDVFLHVLSTDGPVRAERISQGDSVGAAGDGWRVLLDLDGGGKLTLGSREFALANEIVPGRFDG